jgi:hypothetical protein
MADAILGSKLMPLVFQDFIDPLLDRADHVALQQEGS